MSLRDLAYKIAQEEGINPDLFLRQIQAESAFDPQAKSSAGAMGLAQLMPATAKELGVSNPYDPEQSLRGGAKYMKQLLGRYNNDQTLALAAYNAGMGNVDKAGGVPNFKETQNYIAKILGGNSMIGAQAPQQMAQQEQPRGLLGGMINRDFADQLYMAALAGSPNAQRFQPLIQQVAAGQKERRLQKGRNATADYLDRIGQTDAANLLRQGAISAADALSLGKSKNTALIRNALAAGLKEGTPEFQRFILSGGDIFSQKTAILANLPPPEKGMRYDFVEDEMGNITSYRLVPITGSKADKEAEDIQKAADAARKAQSTSGMVVLEDIGKALEIAKESPILSTGFIGGLLKDIGGTPAKNLTSLTTTIKANIGFDRLQRMREESPTGGALGQVAVQELEALQATLGSLDNSQTNAQFVGNLERLEAQYQKSMQEIYNAAIKDQAEGKINKKTGRVISPMDYFSESDIQKLSGGGAVKPSTTTASPTVTHRFNPNTGKVEPVR